MKVLVLWWMLTVMGMGIPMHYVSTYNVSVGDTFTYTVELPAFAMLSIQPTLNGLELIDDRIDERPTATVYQYKLQVFSIENAMIPTLSITEINGVPPVELSPIYLNIVSLLTPTTNQLHDIAPIYSLLYINWVWVSVLLTLLGIAMMAVVAWRKKVANANQRAMRTPKISPRTVALTQMDALKRQLETNPERIKHGYFELTEILCRFLTDETNINVLDATTVEMHRLLKQSQGVSNKHSEQVIAVSHDMDHYKFSKNPELDMAKIQTTMGEITRLIKDISS